MGGIVGGTMKSMGGTIGETLGGIVGGIFGGIMGGGPGSSGFIDEKPQERKTAKPAEQLSEAEKRNRRLQASVLTRNWGVPLLSKKSLLGL